MCDQEVEGCDYTDEQTDGAHSAGKSGYTIYDTIWYDTIEEQFTVVSLIVTFPDGFFSRKDVSRVVIFPDETISYD